MAAEVLHVQAKGTFPMPFKLKILKTEGSKRLKATLPCCPQNVPQHSFMIDETSQKRTGLSPIESEMHGNGCYLRVVFVEFTFHPIFESLNNNCCCYK